MVRVLFVCTGNLYRSPLAAAFFLKKLQTDGRASSWIVESAGTWTIPGKPVPLNFLKAAREFGIDLSSHRTRQLDQVVLSQYDIILVMEKGHREALRIEFPFLPSRIHLLSALADQLEYDIADPASSTLGANEIIMEISRLIDRAYPAICQLVQISASH